MLQRNKHNQSKWGTRTQIHRIRKQTSKQSSKSIVRHPRKYKKSLSLARPFQLFTKSWHVLFGAYSGNCECGSCYHPPKPWILDCCCYYLSRSRSLTLSHSHSLWFSYICTLIHEQKDTSISIHFYDQTIIIKVNHSDVHWSLIARSLVRSLALVFSVKSSELLHFSSIS